MFIKSLSSLLFSQTCYGCEQMLIQQEKLICFDCLSQMEKTNFHLQQEQNELFYRLAGRVPISGATALYFFDKKGRLQRLIKALKYQDAPHLGTRLGHLLGYELQDSSFIQNTDTIIPVPLHRNKKIARGYNQAEFIAKGIAESLNLKVDTQALVRKKATLTQTRKNAEARWENVGEAFACKSSVGQHILLVDDVITTGSTLVACIHALMASSTPPESIQIASIGMARLG
jgi:ComF family protein